MILDDRKITLGLCFKLYELLGLKKGHNVVKRGESMSRKSDEKSMCLKDYRLFKARQV